MPVNKEQEQLPDNIIQDKPLTKRDNPLKEIVISILGVFFEKPLDRKQNGGPNEAFGEGKIWG